MQKLFSKNNSAYAIFNNQSFNHRLTNDIVSFEQLDPDICLISPQTHMLWGTHLNFAANFQDASNEYQNICFHVEI